MQKFIERAEQRWHAGRAERGLDSRAPFEGDPAAEFSEELLDALNYLHVAEQEYGIPEATVRRASIMLYELDEMMMTAAKG